MRTALRYLNIYTLYGRLIRTTSYELGALSVPLSEPSVAHTPPDRTRLRTRPPQPATPRTWPRTPAMAPARRRYESLSICVWI